MQPTTAKLPLIADTWFIRGLCSRCPNCGQGRLFRAFLKVAARCEECGEDFSHHRADDLPAYLVIILVGHILVPLTMIVESTWMPPYWLHAVLWLPLIVGLAVGLLQPVKGAVVALQWHMGMHGFATRTVRS